MGAFIFFILLIFIVLPIAVLSRLFGGIFRFFRRPSDSDPFFRSGRQHGYASSDIKKKKKKVFDRNDGEYVEFEEIVEDIHTTSSEKKEIHYETEEQVSDAEWTEIK